MKNSILFLLIMLGHTALFAMEQSSALDLTTVEPARLMVTAADALKKKDTVRAAACVALKKIFTRMDASCIPGHFDHDQADSVEVFRNSHDFMQQTGPIYHPSDPKQLKDVLERSDFKQIFGQQVSAVGIALVQKTLPGPAWIFSHGSFKTCGSSSDDLVAQEQWFALRLAALKTYHADQELFPAGPPMHIILQAPKLARADHGWCALL